MTRPPDMVAPARSLLAAAVLLTSCAPRGGGQPSGDSDPPVVLGERLAVIGALDAPAEQVFSSLRDVSLLDDGRTLVLDGSSNELRLFDREGRHLGTFAGSGGGPGELRAGWRLLEGPNGGVAVLDRAMRVVEFRWAGSDSLAYARTVHLPFTAGAACRWGDGYALLALDDKGLVHLVDSSGVALGHIGEGFGSGSPLRQEQLSSGQVYCDEASGTIVAASTALGHIRGYDATHGQLLWTDSLPGFEPMLVEDQADGSVRNSSPPEGNHFLRFMVPLRDGGLLLQAIWDLNPTSTVPRRPTLTFVLDPRTRTLEGPWTTLPPIGAANGDLVLVGVPDVDYPQLAPHRLAGPVGE